MGILLMARGTWVVGAGGYGRTGLEGVWFVVGARFRGINWSHCYHSHYIKLSGVIDTRAYTHTDTPRTTTHTTDTTNKLCVSCVDSRNEQDYEWVRTGVICGGSS